MAKEPIFIKMGPHTLDPGRRIFKMDSAQKIGLTEASSQATTRKGKSRGKGNIYGRMAVFMTVIGMITKFKAKEPTSGLTAEYLFNNK